jgi:hypothetical protein
VAAGLITAITSQLEPGLFASAASKLAGAAMADKVRDGKLIISSGTEIPAWYE